MKNLFRNENAVSITLEYIMFSMLFLTLFVLLYMSFGDYAGEGPKETVVRTSSVILVTC